MKKYSLILAFILSIISHIGLAMDDHIRITRLGKVQPGDLGSSWKGDNFNDPTPIVLKTADGPPAVFYLAKHNSTVSVSLEQRLDRINPPSGHSWFGIHNESTFPIAVSGVVKARDAELQIDFIMPDMMVADIDGDGNEELILPRSQGNVAVLSPEKKLFEFRPPSIRHKFYDFSVAASLIVHRSAGDTVYLVMNRQIHSDPEELPPDARHFYQETDNSYLLKIDARGVTPVQLDGLDRKTRNIVAVGAVSHNGVNALIVCSAGADDREMTVARYSLEGKLLAPPRAFYAENMSNPYLAFTFVPASATTLAHSGYTKKVYFISPNKPVNWIRVIDLRRLFPPDGPEAEYLGGFAGPQGTLALLRKGREVYALDGDRRFYHWQGNLLLPEDSPRPMLVLPEESPRHDLPFTQMVSYDGKPALLTVQDRIAQPRWLSDEELDEAARRFLLTDRYDYCQREGVVRFDDIVDFADIYCEDNKLTCPTFYTLDDIKTHIPEFYDRHTKAAAVDRRNCLLTWLFGPLNHEEYPPVTERTYNHPKDYLRWLDQQQESAEIVIGLTAMDGTRLAAKRLNGYELFRAMSVLTLPAVAYRVDNQAHHLLATALRETKKGNHQRPAYYLISW